MKPKTIIMAVLSANGIVALSHDDPVDWTSTEDRKLFKEVTLDAGIIIMGRKTYEMIGKPLHGRLNVVITRYPENHTDSKDLRFTSKQPRKLLELLHESGFSKVVIAGGASVFSQFLNQQLVDEIYLTVMPVFFHSGLSLAPSLEQTVPLSLEEVKEISANALLLHYLVRSDHD